mmetsp:Transcript_9503/g.11825  ORF Transcript_9503/g.11825 Transcript_9503/m.11825 type:complete len:231 (-) Transcript_9503:119-811(-)|eukprot:CAMPEP_0204823008 /NCGR_PEP_ID=MMETSP1346-20131115/1182_1 /ASSEMBLY_ACC=CAM_ASM_000771 /TAXON_ID=215587 /ORGANISM="Aplanochytrium stocchinoi, Strain GSBS06" /LENGTH=230 /DNA_ID=CAMNT_0051949531 /DNA_START=373 /DNA_END=1065 /DNA_ORIENTATION=-
MGGLFSKDKHRPGHELGGKKAPKTPVDNMSTKDQAVLKLKVTRDRLEKAKKKSETERDLYIQKAKALMKEGKKDQAKLALRTKRYKEKHLENLDNQLFKLVQMVNNVEWAESQLEVIDGLKSGTEALKQLNELMPVEEVERIMDENAEALAEQEEISNLLSEGLNEQDEADALAEYETLFQEQQKATTKNTVDVNLPQVPTKPVDVDVIVNQGTENAAQDQEKVKEPVAA